MRIGINKKNRRKIIQFHKTNSYAQNSLNFLTFNNIPPNFAYFYSKYRSYLILKTTLSKKAIIIEDFKLIAQIWQSILEEQGIVVLKTFDNADNIENEIIELSPDIILMDINLKGKVDGIELTSKLTKLKPDFRVLVLTMHNSKSYMQKAKEAGARGYLSKNSPVNELNLAIESVLNNQLYFKSL